MEEQEFAEDIYPQHLLYAQTIRSPVAKGRLLSVECPKLPSGYTLIAATDIPGLNQLEKTANAQQAPKGQSSLCPVLAQGSVSYIGEPVAILVGPEPSQLEMYAAQCEIKTEMETPVFSYDFLSDNEILAERNIYRGASDIFRQQHRAIQSTYRTGIQEHWYSEPHGAVAVFDTETGHCTDTDRQNTNLIVYTATQWPFHVKLSIANMLKIDPARVIIKPTSTGLHMDGKLFYPSLVACHAALGAWISKKPVRLMLSKEEDFRYSPKRNDSEITISTMLNDSDDILANEISITINSGNYGGNAQEIVDQTALGSLGVYRMDNVKLSARAIKTNIPPQGPFSGFGLAQGFFALERHVSFIADICNINPAQWRKEQCIKKSSLPSGLLINEIPPIAQIIDMSVSMSDYNRKWASYELIRRNRKQHTQIYEKGEILRGIGIAQGWQGSGFIYRYSGANTCEMAATLEKDGSLEIKTGMNPHGNDLQKAVSEIAGEILGMESHKVKMTYDANASDSGPCCASRNITIQTKLAEHCCLDIQKLRFRDPLPITVHRTFEPNVNLKWKELYAPADPENFDAAGFTNPAWAAAVVEVEVDPIEFIPKVRGIWMSVDGGRILLENRARRNLKIAAVQALGWASREQLDYVDGRLTQEQFSAYDIPGPADIPPIHINFLKPDSDLAKGIGELPFNCIPAAYIQAVSQALDNHFLSIPLLPHDIWEMTKNKMEVNPA